jgi:cystathionine gamma-synthase
MTDPDHLQQGFDTLAIHAGQEPDALTGAVVVPIYQTSTYKQDGVGGVRGGYEYSRSANPTRTALEEALAALEGGTRGLAFASGLAAEDTLLRAACRPGDHVLLPNDAYGGTFRLVARVLGNWGIEHTPVPLGDLDAVRAAMRPNTRIVWCETPTNPLLGIADVAALAEIAHSAGARLVVDNTFASPYLQQPIRLGADVVVHSTTKYIGGHSDVLGGFVATNNDELAAKLKFHQYAIGAVPGPLDCYLLLRGVKTLGVRMDRHCSNARAVAAFLCDHPSVERVYYPGLASHPGHDVAASQMSDFGGMVSFTLKSGVDVAKKVCESTSVFILAESLGGVESLIELPSAMTHLSVAGSLLEPPGGLVRLSVGIEDLEDLIDDLARALAVVAD